MDELCGFNKEKLWSRMFLDDDEFENWLKDYDEFENWLKVKGRHIYKHLSIL